MTGEAESALDRSLQAESLLREHVRRTARALSEREALLYERIRSRGLDVALSVVADQGRRVGSFPGAPERVWEQVVRSRALVLDEMAARHRAVFELESPEMDHLLTNLNESRERFTRLVARGRPWEDPARYRSQVEDARAAMEGDERDLAGRSALFRRKEAKDRVGLAEIAASLPPGSALVSYVHYARLARGAAGPAAGAPASVASYLALILRAGERRVIAVPLGAADEIESRVGRWREAIKMPAGGARALGRYRRAAAGLREAVWDPVVREIPSARELFIVPDGAIDLVNFATLPDSGDRYLLETGPLLHHLSSERDLVDAERRPTGRGLLVMGGADFGEARRDDLQKGGEGKEGVLASPSPANGRDASPPCPGSMTFAPLPSSRLEADEVESLWLKADHTAIKLTGARANEAAFKKNAPGRRVLHLATHGFFLDGSCGGRPFRGVAGRGGWPPAGARSCSPGSRWPGPER
jgi:CHAT domain-containing protein